MPNLLTNLRLLGILATDKDGDMVFIPFKQLINIAGNVDTTPAGGVVTPPTPEEDRISKERIKDLSLSGVLNKAKNE